jgi:hypothetical protein
MHDITHLEEEEEEEEKKNVIGAEIVILFWLCTPRDGAAWA